MENYLKDWLYDLKWKFSQSRLNSLNNIKHPYGQRVVKVLTKLHQGKYHENDDMLKAIEDERNNMLTNDSPLIDGSLKETGIDDKGFTIKDVCEASKSPRSALLLYLLIREFKPSTVLELGTNVGITSAYEALAIKRNTSGIVFTLDASPYRLQLAKKVHKNLKLSKFINYTRGLFENILKRVLQNAEPIDFAFIDGHHQYQPTLDYFDTIYEHSTDQAIFIFDDINWSPGMKRAWNEVQHDKRLDLIVDAGSMGIGVKLNSNAESKPYSTRPIYIL